jgi:hypothetical protein
MATTAITMKVGDQVYRKSDFGNGRSFYGYLGTIERLLTYRSGKVRAYVCWHRAMHLVRGDVDSHSTIALGSLVPATAELAQRLQEVKAEINRKHQEYTAMMEAKRIEQFNNATEGLYWHIRCPKTRPGAVSPARFQRIDPAIRTARLSLRQPSLPG